MLHCFFFTLSLYKEFREHRVGFYYIYSMSTRESVQPIYEMGCSLAHWSSGPILSPTYSWPAVWPTHTHVLVHTHGTPSVPHCGGEDSGKWGQRSCVVIHLSSVTAAANKSLIHGLIHRLSSAQTGKQCTGNTVCLFPNQDTLTYSFFFFSHWELFVRRQCLYMLTLHLQNTSTSPLTSTFIVCDFGFIKVITLFEKE